MAIVIPQKNIFNYDFNILVDNYIEKVEIAQDSILGYQPVKHYFTYSNGTWSCDTLEILSQSTKTISTNSGSITYARITFPFEPNLLIYGTNFVSTINNMELNITNQDGSIDNEVIGYLYSFGLDSYASIDNIGNGKLFFKEEYDYFDGNYVLYIKTKEVVDSTTITSSNATFIINVNETKYPEDVEEEINTIDIYTLPHADLFHYFNYINDGVRVKKSIQDNIIGNYNKGKMTLNIETRYTTFKDDSGNDVNEGKPYLIRVGDIVKPQMTPKFSNFEYEYLVTSVEYEYNGSDKVFLKLLQR